MIPVQTFLRNSRHFRAGLPLALALLAVIVTGCPRNDYIVQLQPEGDRIRRTLTFYCADGVDAKTGQPNYRSMGSNEPASIFAVYPAPLLRTNGQRYTVQGDFTNILPADIGGAGVYGHYATGLGEADFYTERFRGDDDLAGMFEQRARAADQLTDRLALVADILRRLDQQGWPNKSDAGWSDYDVELYDTRWSRLQLTTVVEEQPESKQLIRCRLRGRWALRSKLAFWTLCGLELLVCGLVWPRLPWVWSLLLTLPLFAWFLRGQQRNLQSMLVVFLDALAGEWHMTRIQPTQARQSLAEPKGAP